MSRRVVITGLGLVTPVGNDVPTSWENIVNGVSGVVPITYFDTTNYEVKIAAQVKDFDPANYMPYKEVRRHDPYQHYQIAAATEAIADSGLEITEEMADRSSVILGSATGGMHSFQTYSTLIYETDNPRKMTPFAIPMLVANGGSDVVAIQVGARGPSAPLVSACATGADTIGFALQMIQMGRIDRAIAGAGDFPIINLGIAAFDRVGACSRHNDDPAGSVRPFDLNRTGMVFGEGAGVLVLEELEFAKARGANILAELVGFASTTDAYHRTAPAPDGRGAAHAVKLALADGGINVTDVSYINAHGTATSLNDPTETTAIKLALGDHAYKVPMSSTKSMTGHAMGATAAMEAVFSTLAIRDNVAPPTINYETPDPDCDLDYVPNTARQMPIDVVVSNAFGFGGHNASLVIKRFTD